MWKGVNSMDRRTCLFLDSMIASPSSFFTRTSFCSFVYSRRSERRTEQTGHQHLVRLKSLLAVQRLLLGNVDSEEIIRKNGDSHLQTRRLGLRRIQHRCETVVVHFDRRRIDCVLQISERTRTRLGALSASIYVSHRIRLDCTS